MLRGRARWPEGFAPAAREQVSGQPTAAARRTRAEAAQRRRVFRRAGALPGCASLQSWMEWVLIIKDSSSLGKPKAGNLFYMNRCSWANTDSMMAYHDTEWGVP